MKTENLKLNGSGCKDPTAYEGIKPIISDEKKAHKLIKNIKFFIEIAGFELIGRIQIKDKKSGREYR